MSTRHSGRAYLEHEVEARLEHRTAESVRTTCSFARAERLLGGEYHGRFLIELLQNAADAWRKDPRAETSRSRVKVILTEEPALIVANQGIALTPEVVIESLGHIGASTKSEGEAIGHKGIGFKSVLEMTSQPEVYSGLQEEELTLSVLFDPNEALARIRAVSSRWDEFVERTQGLDAGDPLAPIPVLRYPMWVESIPPEIQTLAQEGYDTAVRLPFDPDIARRRGVVSETWTGDVRRSLKDDLSDQILLLLGTFCEVVVENRLDGGSPVTIWPEVSEDPVPAVAEASGESVSIKRTGAAPTHWRIYRRSILGDKGLAGEIAVGLRYEPDSEAARAVPAVDGTSSAPFHLFFPTRIPSGLPFLLHGYFKVDASRKGFHGGAKQANERILKELATLVRDVVRAATHDDALDAASLVNLVAACSVPQDVLAAAFREQALTLLDDEEWIPVLGEGSSRLASPGEFLADRPSLARLISEVFPPRYVRERTRLALIHPSLTDAAIELVLERQGGVQDRWKALGDLFRPGQIGVWSEEEADAGFRKLITLVSWLRGEFPDKAEPFLASLRGDPNARLVPVVSEIGGRILLPLPDPSEGVAGKRSQLVMARIRSSGAGTPAPPRQLEVAFLSEGLLRNQQEVDQARPLGVRPFTVDNVLDRLSGVGETTESADAVVTFLWRFLARERRSPYGTKRVAERAKEFDPTRWFWCRPGRAQEGDTRRLEQQRERYLSSVLLPARSGTWHPAGELAFGADWAAWIEANSAGMPEVTLSARARAYRQLEAVCPNPEELLLAPPEQMVGLLEEFDIGFRDASEQGDDERDADGAEFGPEDELDDAGWDRERHALLLRLGVWEVLPLEAYEGRDWRRRRDKFPWKGATQKLQRESCTVEGAWTFGMDGWKGKRHHDVYLGEDYRFRWSLGAAAQRDATAAASLLRAGARLYEGRLLASVFCPGCRDAGTGHQTPRQSSTADGYPSWLALELRTERWVPVEIEGLRAESPARPSRAWWLEKPPAGQGLMTSPWRFVPICSPRTGVTDELRRIAQVTKIDHADASALKALLREVRRKFDDGHIDLTRSTGRRSFVSLHTMIYERLADLSDQAGKAVLNETGVLCSMGNALMFQSSTKARHDDGAYSSYVRHFVDHVPLAVIPRDRVRTATALGIRKLRINLRRDGDAAGLDVTDDLTGMLRDRLPQLLAILVHHSLGSQTLTLDSQEFRERAQRLKRLTVRKVDDLVIHASVEGIDYSVLLGQHSSEDLFLEPAATGRPPVLYIDFEGGGWQDRLRRKLAPHLAAVLDATPYTHTFALFLQAEEDSEREEFLLELGISDADVDSVASQLGVVSEAERASHRRWFTALLRLRSFTPPERFDHKSLQAALEAAGFDVASARVLLEAGGGDEVRANSQPGSALRTLHGLGIDLPALDAELRKLSKDDGLRITETRRAFNDWKRTHERRVVAVRSRSVSPDTAKAQVRDLVAPKSQVLTLDAPLADVLAPIARLIAPTEAVMVARQLDTDPVGTLARLGGFATVRDLDAAAAVLYDVEEQRAALRARAARWKAQIRRLAVLVRITRSETRSGVRHQDEYVAGILSAELLKPSDLIGPVENLFASHASLSKSLIARLDDGLFGSEPDEAEIRGWIAAAGLDDGRIATYERALDEPRNRRAAQLAKRARRLSEGSMTALVPKGLVAPKPPVPRNEDGDTEAAKAAPIKISQIKVSPTIDQRKRELGDEGEQWALADVLGKFLAMNDDERATAVQDIRRLLGYFEPGATTSLLEHASAASGPRDDDDGLIAALEGLLHVSRHSDGFGFDIIGWASPGLGRAPQALCLEVKSTRGDGFHLSRTEWSIAGELRSKGAGDRYAVLAVRRGKSGEIPAAMDLLVDPVGLEAAGLLHLDTDGYVARYTLGR